jgi:hypothetical protein
MITRWSKKTQNETVLKQFEISFGTVLKQNGTK